MHQVLVRPVYTVDDFCRDFRVGRSTFYAEVRSGRLRTFTVGDRRMVAGEDAFAWRDRCRAAAQPAAA
jgi:hypothetical protein